MKKTKKPEFDLDMIYAKKYSKEKIIKLIDNCSDKEFIVIFLPRDKQNSDILIRSLNLEITKEKSTHKSDNTQEKGK